MHDIHRRGEWATLYGAGAAGLAMLVLTSVHHLYGARRFDTPWRAHVAHIAAWAGVLFGVCLLVARFRAHRTSGRMAMGAFVALAVAICVLWLGLYEGGYNHGIKNLAFMAQLPATVLNAVFPPSLYEPPGDWFFEFSGVLQLRSVCLRDEWRGEHTQHPEGHDVARPQQDIASHRCVLILSASDPPKRPAPSPQLDERHPLGHRDAPIARLG